jgi:hypothetical protein
MYAGWAPTKNIRVNGEDADVLEAQKPAPPLVELQCGQAIRSYVALCHFPIQPQATHLDGLGSAIISILDVELYRLALAQRAEALRDDGGLVNEEVLTTCRGGEIGRGVS